LTTKPSFRNLYPSRWRAVLCVDVGVSGTLDFDHGGLSAPLHSADAGAGPPEVAAPALVVNTSSGSISALGRSLGTAQNACRKSHTRSRTHRPSTAAAVDGAETWRWPPDCRSMRPRPTFTAGREGSKLILRAFTFSASPQSPILARRGRLTPVSGHPAAGPRVPGVSVKLGSILVGGYSAWGPTQDGRRHRRGLEFQYR